MKKFILFFIPLFLFSIISCNKTKEISNNIDDWFKAGSRPVSYETGKDDNVKYDGEPSLYIKSILDAADGFGTIMMNMKPDDYIGKRIKLTGFIKSENLSDWAGMWMRVDGPEKDKELQFDNMKNRPIKGSSDWTKYAIVLDVPEQSTNIALGILVSGSGQIWFNRMQIEVVGKEYVTTNLQKTETAAEGWIKAGTVPNKFEIGKDENVKYNGTASNYIKAVSDVKEGFGTIMKQIPPGIYLGKRIRLTGNIKTENVDNQAAMWMRVDGPNTGKSLQFDNMTNRPIKGTTEWTKYEIVLDVPQNSTNIAYGVLNGGNGEVWFDDLKFEVVGNDVPTTNMIK